MSNQSTGSQFVWMKVLQLIGLLFVCVAFGYITVWSFFQTREWFAFLDFDGNEYVSLSLAFIFQYGQGPVLFLRGLFIYRKMKLEAELRRRSKGTIEYAIVEHELRMAVIASWSLLALFIIFAWVDAWTNIKQMHGGLDSKVLAGEAITRDKYLFTSVVGIFAVFVEEGLGLSFSLASHTYNDIRQVFGYARVKWLDTFADNARSLLSGDVGGGKGNDHGHKSGGSFGGDRRGNQPSSFRGNSFNPIKKGAPNSPSFHTPKIRDEEPSFHPVSTYRPVGTDKDD